MDREWIDTILLNHYNGYMPLISKSKRIFGHKNSHTDSGKKSEVVKEVETIEVIHPEPSLSIEQEKSSLTPLAITFNGQTIRNFSKNKHVYFVVIDLLPLAKIADFPEDGLLKLQEDKEFKKGYNEIVKTIDVVEKGQKSSYACVTIEGFERIKKELLKTGKIFPGQFPEWLKMMSQLLLSSS